VALGQRIANSGGRPSAKWSRGNPKSHLCLDQVRNGHLIAGALAKVKITPELQARIERVAANCDSEIIHAH